PLRNALPPGRLPDLERPALPAEAPADGEVHVARRMRDVREVHRDVVEEIAIYRPQELRLRMRGGAQLAELLRGVLLLEDRLHLVGDHARGQAIVLLREVEDVDVAALLHV